MESKYEKTKWLLWNQKSSRSLDPCSSVVCSSHVVSGLLGSSIIHAIGLWLVCSVVWSVGNSAVQSCLRLLTQSFGRAIDSWIVRLFCRLIARQFGRKVSRLAAQTFGFVVEVDSIVRRCSRFVTGLYSHAVSCWLACSTVPSVGGWVVGSSSRLVTQTFGRAIDSWLSRSAVRPVMARCEVGWLLRHSVVLSVEVWSFGRATDWYMYLGCTVLQSVVGSVIRLYLRLVARSFVRS